MHTFCLPAAGSSSSGTAGLPLFISEAAASTEAASVVIFEGRPADSCIDRSLSASMQCVRVCTFVQVAGKVQACEACPATLERIMPTILHHLEEWSASSCLRLKMTFANWVFVSPYNSSVSLCEPPPFQPDWLVSPCPVLCEHSL
jgi:hypothetical protein